jgi:hypothetical protein
LKRVLKKLALVEKTGVEFKASLIRGAAKDCGDDERSE